MISLFSQALTAQNQEIGVILTPGTRNFLKDLVWSFSVWPGTPELPCLSADPEWLMHFLSGYYPSSHGPDRSFLLRPLTLFHGQDSFPFCHFSLSGQFCFLCLVSSPYHKVIQGVRVRNLLLLVPPSVYCDRMPLGSGHTPEWQICIDRTWLSLSLAVLALLSTGAPWACIILCLWDEPETKAWESWEPLSLVCKHTEGLAHFSVRVGCVTPDKILCDLGMLIFRTVEYIQIVREVRFWYRCQPVIFVFWAFSLYVLGKEIRRKWCEWTHHYWLLTFLALSERSFV